MNELPFIYHEKTETIALLVSLLLCHLRRRRYGICLTHLCERVGFSIDIPDGFRGAADDVSGGGLFLSSVATAVDFSSSSFLHKTTAEVRSSMKMYLGGVTRCWLLRLHQHLTLLVKFGDGLCLVSSCLRRTTARAAAGRPSCVRVALCDFRSAQGSFCNLLGCTVLLFNIYPLFKKKLSSFVRQHKLQKVDSITHSE
jgi:hypothetical protein